MFSLPRKHYQTLNEIRLHADHFLHNYEFLKKHNSNKKIGIILKSNAYGHGLCETAQICDPFGAQFFMVDSTYEALILKDAHIKTPILVLGYNQPSNLRIKKYPFHFVANSLKQLELLLESQTTPIHIFINTGMNREGIHPDMIENAINIIGNKKNRIIGLCTHFFEAEIEPPTESTSIQEIRFHNSIKNFEAAGITFQWIHSDASNSTTHLNTHGNLIRAGRIFYGTGNDHELYSKMKPPLEFTSTIVDIKHLKSGDRVGYNGTYTANKPTTIALIPAGYQEGVHRNLSNKGTCIVNKQPCPIIGRISMNYTTIDITNTNAQIGDTVIIYSNNQSDQNSITNAAQTAQTIEHELLCYVSPTIRKTII